MLRAHMPINPVSTRERLHALPADVRLALRARNVVTPLVALDRHLAPRAALHPVRLHPLVELGRAVVRGAG